MKSCFVVFSASVFLAATAAFAGTPDLPACDVYWPACHYTVSSRPSSYIINKVVVHKTQGATAAGAAGWFADCNSPGSAHYTFDKSNGYCYQSVLEKDIAWHAGHGPTNANSIGIEHSGWVTNNDTSKACYNESGWETRSCCVYYGTPFSRTYIIGHIEVPGCLSGTGGGVDCHTDPGPYWDWTYYMSACHPSVTGAIRSKWLSLGGSRCVLGNPTTTEKVCPDGVGRYNHFSGGSIYWTSSTSAHEVHGAIRTLWSSLGWEKSRLGYPTSDEYAWNGYRRNNFQKGYIRWSASTGAVAVYY